MAKRGWKRTTIPFRESLMHAFLAIQVGCLVLCIIMMLTQTGVMGLFEAVVFWLISQVVIAPVSIVLVPLAAMCRQMLPTKVPFGPWVAALFGAGFAVICVVLIFAGLLVSGGVPYLSAAIGGIAGGLLWHWLEGHFATEPMSETVCEP